MTAPRLTVVAVDAWEHPFRLRLPFRFGVVTVTHGQQATVRVRIRLEDGREADGYGSETLAAKWFDKDPALSDAQNHDQLRRALEIATGLYRAAGPNTAFGLFARTYAEQVARCGAEALPPLVAAFGPALLDRAVMDALCRVTGLGFPEAMRRNLSGITALPLAPDLAGFDLPSFLAALTLPAAMTVRHTVGLLDPLVAADQAPGTRVADGLPETLEEVVSAYNQRSFKLKLCGDPGADRDRLCRIAAVLDRIPHPYRVTLDGNEQFADAEAAAALWRTLEGEERLSRLLAATALVEQPVRRAAALSQPVHALARHRPVMIDESDDAVDSFPRARVLGYAGVSSKACKGLYKSVLNAARCAAAPGTFMSAEDLTTQAGLSVQQDLALAGLLGLVDVERNGHHFIDGFEGRTEEEARAFLRAHPDLYGAENGRVRLRIVDGTLRTGSLGAVGFGSAVVPVVAGLARMPGAAWRGA